MKPLYHVEFPYGEGGLVVEPPPHRDFRINLEWLAQNADEEEVRRIITGAAIILTNTDERVSAALDTAIVWERG